MRRFQPAPRPPVGLAAAAAAADGGERQRAVVQKLSRLMCVHPRRRTSASYARAASSLVAKCPTLYTYTCRP